IGVRLLCRSAGQYRRTDSITVPGTPIPLAADTFCCPPETRIRNHLPGRACSSSALATLAEAPQNGVFLPPVTTPGRCRRTATHALFGRTRRVGLALPKRSTLRDKARSD